MEVKDRLLVTGKCRKITRLNNGRGGVIENGK